MPAAHAQQRPLSALINRQEPGWALVGDWIKRASNKVRVLRSTLTALFLLWLAAAAGCQQRQPVTKQSTVLQAPTGIFVGLDEMRGMPPEKPGDRWYHENLVYIRPDSLFLEGNPIIIHQNGEKGYSASDGGFYSYSGRIDTANGRLVATLRMFQHDYLAEPFLIKDTVATKGMTVEEMVRQGLAYRDSSFYKKTYTIQLTTTGFDMDSVHYAPTTLAKLPGVFPIGFPDTNQFFKKTVAQHP